MLSPERTETNKVSFNFWMIKFTVMPKKIFGTWQFDFIIQKFVRLKSKHFSQLFWWEVDMRELRAFILQKVQASVVERQKNKFCSTSLNFGKVDTIIRIVSVRDRSRDSTPFLEQKMRPCNLQKQVKKVFGFQNCSDLSLFK